MTFPDHNARSPAPRPARPRWLVLCAAVALAVIALDQATKALVRSRLALGESWPEGWELIRISHITNTGAAFGMFRDATTILSIGALIAGLVIVVLIYRFAASHRWYAICLSLILGGAAGNLIDRVRLGHVTDFINPIAYPAFNVADSSIVIGVATLLILTLFDRGEPSSATETAGDQEQRSAVPQEPSQ
jgi:signal peptidase II